MSLKAIKSIPQSVFATMVLVVCSTHFGSELVGQPSSHLYKVSGKENKVGFIDSSGKMVIAFDRLPAGTMVGSFSEGLAPICFLGRNSNSCGYIDEKGKIVIPPRFSLAGDFSEGLAWISTEAFFGFINHAGKVVFEIEAMSMGFHDGLAAVSTKTGWGFIDRNGRFISAKRWVKAERFSEGLAAVAEGPGKNVKYGFIDEKGEVAIPLEFDPRLGPHFQPAYLGRFTEGLAAVRVGSLYGYIDYKGNVVIPPVFRDAGEFSEGLASVTTSDAQKGYIDKAGRLVIKLRSGSGDKFSEGLAVVAVYVDGRTKMGYIDHTGRTIIEPKFDMAYDFTNGLAEVYFVEKLSSASEPVTQTVQGYIDRQGRFVWRNE